jgi:hypothetical protein
MIDPKKLTLADIGKAVIYENPNWRSGSKTPKRTKGVIFSFSRERIDVIYEGDDYAIGTRPDDLMFYDQ